MRLIMVLSTTTLMVAPSTVLSYVSSHHHHLLKTTAVRTWNARLLRRITSTAATPPTSLFASASFSSSSSSSSSSFEETETVGDATAAITTVEKEDDDDKVWRPTISDVERISFGQPAKVKGTGSRGIPHRLNAMEREWFQIARCKGYLTTPGSAYRSQRRDAPLINTYRNLCDARAQPCIVLHKQNTGYDTVVVDVSPLRNTKLFPIVAHQCQQRLDDKIQQSSSLSPLLWDDPSNSIIPEVSWRRLPIYQLPPYTITWESIPRSDAKRLCQALAETFQTMEGKIKRDHHAHKSKNVRPGKNRRHGGYGIEG